jgi:hypothetical protein
MTNKGLGMECHSLPSEDPNSLIERDEIPSIFPDIFWVPLQCREYKSIWGGIGITCAIRLQHLGGDQFARISPMELPYPTPRQVVLLLEQPRRIFHIKQRGDTEWTFQGVGNKVIS